MNKEVIAKEEKRAYAIAAICDSCDWTSYLVFDPKVSSQEIDSLKRELNKHVIEHIKSGQGKRVNLFYGSSLFDLTKCAEGSKVKIPEELTTKLRLRLDWLTR